MKKTKLLKLISVIAAIVIWQIVAMQVGMDMLLASPLKVLVRFTDVWKEKEFFSTVLFSFFRITSGFLIAFILGTVLGVVAGKIHIIEILLWPYVITIKSVPIASFIIMCLIWMNYSQLTVLISFLIAFPMIYSNVLQGIKSTDNKMIEVAKIYRLSLRKQLLYIYLPSVKPFIISASSIAVGMTWKAGVAAEIIGIIDGSIGEKLYNAKIYFQNSDLLCWTLVIIIISIITEKLFALLLKLIFRTVERL